MAERKLKFEKGLYYHIYNRGVDKRKIFMDKGDLYYFFDSMQIFNQKEIIEGRSGSRDSTRKKSKSNGEDEKLVSVISYCLLPNHFHFILKEEIKGGISKFMQKLGNSYVRFFNQKHGRKGALLQGRFKASVLAFENSLEKTSAYVNTNYKHHKYDPSVDLIKTSLFEFLDTEKGERICNKKDIDFIIEEAGGLEKYKKNLKEYEKEFLKVKEEEEENPTYKK